MVDDLPKEFNLVVVGTGFTESCVAAAASRIGKSVLQIDHNDFYGGAWASFNLESLCHHMDNGIGNEIRHMSYTWCTGDDFEKTQWSKSKLLNVSRRFNIDLCPKILYAAGELVQLLISSNICRYAEFRAVDQVCTKFENKLLKVPCSRSDIFNTKELNIVEKRLLMKFLTACLLYDENKSSDDIDECHNKTFYEYLLQQKVTEKIISCIMQAIAMCDKDTPFDVGMQRTKLFLNSLGRYGNTPFLFPMYGCGEIPQCFCRLCAVFGGIYCLNREIEDIAINEDANTINLVLKEKLENSDQYTIQADHIICSHSNISLLNLLNTHGKIENHLSRAILITNGPLGNEELNAGGGGVNFLRLVVDTREAMVIQLSHYSGTCPKDTFIFHLTTMSVSDKPEQDLQMFIKQLFSVNDSPSILFSAYFTLTAYKYDKKPVISSSIICTDSPCYEVDYDKSIQNARDIFKNLYNDAEFLPRAPDPEEILIEGEDPRALSDVNLPEDLRAQMRELETVCNEMENERKAEEII